MPMLGNMPIDPDFERREGEIHAYESGTGWLADVMEYAGLDLEACADLVACFFRDRAGREVPMDLAAWAAEIDDATYEEKRKAVCEARGWSSDLSLAGILHLEAIGREAYKHTLHSEWLTMLDATITPGQALRILDYGCGASSFGDLALERPEVHCTLADVDPEVVAWLRWKYERRAPGRVTLHALELRNAISKRARVSVDCSSIEGRYDVIVLADILEHTLDPLEVLAHLLPRLNPGGFIFVNYPSEIEGDWHTPEAFHLRPWCFALLRLWGSRVSPCIYRVRSGRWPKLALRLLDAARPRLLRRAQRFTRRTFRKQGEQLAAAVRERAHRKVTAEQLLASVEG
jgi:SAM-dependent methyltransferase